MFKSKVAMMSDSFSLSDKKIADYFLSDGNVTLSTATSYELAGKLNLAQSTIVRFAKKLGYSGYREMLMDISYSSGHSETIDEIEENESTEQTLRKVQQRYRKIVDLLSSSNSPETYDKVIEKIIGAKTVFCFGIGQSYLLAEYLSTQLHKLGIDARCHYSAVDQYLNINNGSSDDIVILLSAKGLTPEIHKCARLAKKKHMCVISMTGLIKNKLYDLSDIVLKAPSFDSKTSLSDGTRRFSQMAIIDVIYVSIIKTNYNHYTKLLDIGDTLVLEYQ